MVDQQKPVMWPCRNTIQMRYTCNVLYVCSCQVSSVKCIIYYNYADRNAKLRARISHNNIIMSLLCCKVLEGAIFFKVHGWLHMHLQLTHNYIIYAIRE